MSAVAAAGACTDEHIRTELDAALADALKQASTRSEHIRLTQDRRAGRAARIVCTGGRDRHGLAVQWGRAVRGLQELWTMRGHARSRWAWVGEAALVVMCLCVLALASYAAAMMISQLTAVMSSMIGSGREQRDQCAG